MTAGLKYSEILAANRRLGEELDSTSPYKILVLANTVVNQLVDILEYSLRVRGVNARATIGDYNNIVQNSRMVAGYNAVLVFWEAGNLAEGLGSGVGCYSNEKVDDLIGHFSQEVESVIAGLSGIPLVLFNKFSAAPFLSSPLPISSLGKICEKLNIVLDHKRGPNVLPVNTDSVFASVGLTRAVDFRQYQVSGALYTVEFFKCYVEGILPAVLSVVGMTKKVLVLDCDDTLWGGVVGEDGVGGIQLGGTTRAGKVYKEVQSIFKGLKAHGAILALCSKNNPDDVLGVFRGHPEMVLRETDISAQRVNWADKATNIRDLARELNLGLDSFVFVDNSSFEVGLVAREIPEVTVVQVPETLSNFPAVARGLGPLFFSFGRTAEDLNRTRMYLDEAKRKDLRVEFSETEDYLRALGLKMVVFIGDKVPVARAAQLTQKTNQFNLTTSRHTEAEIQRFVDDGNHLVAAISVSDRYGDYGVTGLCVVREVGSRASVDIFLMSCRVIGRNIEYAVMDYLVDTLERRGIDRLSGTYRPTPKNSQTASFYDSSGFMLISDSRGEKAYELKLAEYVKSGIDYIEVTEGA